MFIYPLLNVVCSTIGIIRFLRVFIFSFQNEGIKKFTLFGRDFLVFTSHLYFPLIEFECFNFVLRSKKWLIYRFLFKFVTLLWSFEGDFLPFWDSIRGPQMLWSEELDTPAPAGTSVQRTETRYRCRHLNPNISVSCLDNIPRSL